MYGIVNIVNVMPASIKAVGMFLCQSLINCVIVSGTGQAAVTMPLMGYLAVSKIPYSKWLKFMMPLFLIWTALGCLFMLGALMIGY